MTNNNMHNSVSDSDSEQYIDITPNNVRVFLDFCFDVLYKNTMSELINKGYTDEMSYRKNQLAIGEVVNNYENNWAKVLSLCGDIPLGNKTKDYAERLPTYLYRPYASYKKINVYKRCTINSVIDRKAYIEAVKQQTEL